MCAYICRAETPGHLYPSITSAFLVACYCVIWFPFLYSDKPLASAWTLYQKIIRCHFYSLEIAFKIGNLLCKLFLRANYISCSFFRGSLDQWSKYQSAESGAKYDTSSPLQTNHLGLQTASKSCTLSKWNELWLEVVKIRLFSNYIVIT